jgi:sialate O-acetylesterase
VNNPASDSRQLAHLCGKSQGAIFSRCTCNVDEFHLSRSHGGQSRLIIGWRQDWGIGRFPFFFAQLPNWNNGDDASHESWAFFREGQANTLKVPNTGMAVTIDIGEAGNIHPKNKQEAGRRLALLAQAKVYHQEVISQGPQYWKIEPNGAHIKIYSHHADGGLVAHGDVLKGFTIAGVDKGWQPAEARIDGDAVIVLSRGLSQPTAVRYGWANNPNGNLFNGAGLPGSPFRTDHWP